MNTEIASESLKLDMEKAQKIAEIINSLPDETKITLYGIVEGLRLAANIEKQPA